MKIFILVLLVAVFFYMEIAGTTTCRMTERPVECNNWKEQNKSCHEGSCYSPTPLGGCKPCRCDFEDDDHCETKCVCVDGTLRQPNEECREPSDCPADSPGFKMSLD
uniref:Putative til domain protein n=1 Tax=Ixodes ricinus TaxID=34613 RepID=A0A0K8RDD6_IXORI